MPIFLGDEIEGWEYDQLIVDMETFNLLHDQARLLLKAHRRAHEKMVEMKNLAESYADGYYLVHKIMKELKPKIEKGHEQLKKGPRVSTESAVEAGGC